MNLLSLQVDQHDNTVFTPMHICNMLIHIRLEFDYSDHDDGCGDKEMTTTTY